MFFSKEMNLIYSSKCLTNMLYLKNKLSKIKRLKNYTNLAILLLTYQHTIHF